MDWLQKMNGAVDYIEENLTDVINYSRAAQLACCSVYHFQRMFSFITDMPLSEYIRRRRLTLAAFDLQNSNTKVIDIALKYGYESPEAFSRAFFNLHGVTPTTARNVGIQLKAYPRISFQILVKGDVEMNYRIEQKQAEKVFGKSIIVRYDEIQQYDDIRKFVEQSIQNGVVQSILDTVGAGPFENLANTSESDDKAHAGLFVFKENDEYSIRFMIAAEYPDHEVGNDFEILDIPEATWAVFSMAGKTNTDEDLDTITHIWKRLGEWFQVSGYEYVSNIPELEKRYKTQDGYLAEVWVPVSKTRA